jgi:hypothetical protein
MGIKSTPACPGTPLGGFPRKTFRLQRRRRIVRPSVVGIKPPYIFDLGGTRPQIRKLTERAVSQGFATTTDNKNMQKKDNKKTLIYGTDDIFFEVVSQVTGENQFGRPDETTFSSLRVHATPNSKTPQIPNVIPLASNYLKNWQGAGPLHDIRQDEYSAVLDKKGLVRCALVETDHKQRDPTEYALENKAYSWQYGA